MTAEYKSDYFDRVEAQGEVKLFLKILKSRWIALTDDQRDVVTSCTNPNQVELWADRVLDGAISADDIFKGIGGALAYSMAS